MHLRSALAAAALAAGVAMAAPAQAVVIDLGTVGAGTSPGLFGVVNTAPVTVFYEPTNEFRWTVRLEPLLRGQRYDWFSAGSLATAVITDVLDKEGDKVGGCGDLNCGGYLADQLLPGRYTVVLSGALSSRDTFLNNLELTIVTPLPMTGILLAAGLGALALVRRGTQSKAP
jgi:hypothetical protein